MTSSPSPCAARLLAAACTAAVLAGCANVTEGQRNVMIGTGVGAAAGGLIGDGRGAAIGAAVGALSRGERTGRGGAPTPGRSTWKTSAATWSA